MQKTGFLSQIHSATSFLNALFLEWKDYQLVKLKEGQAITLPLNSERSILIPLKHYSKIGRHHYEGKYFLRTSGHTAEIDFPEMVRVVSEYLEKKLAMTPNSGKEFLERVQNSVEHVEMAVKKRKDLSQLAIGPLSFQQAEQGLFIGHTFHPTPKSRSEFTPKDYENYSAEMAASFPLEWFLISEDLFFQKSSMYFTQLNWMSEIFLNDFDETLLKDQFVPFPLHPWQKKYVLENIQVQRYQDQGKIISLGAGKQSWIPTSSLRTLHNEDSAYMLKFSLNVRLTNSLRTLLVHELDRGIQIHEVFNQELTKAFSSAYPEFEVIHEPLYAGIKDDQGRPIPESLFVLRFNPFKEKKESIVLATLTQDGIEFKHNLIHTYVQNLANTGYALSEASSFWFGSFLKVAVKPLILLQANLGILLGSHQQNMILDIENNLPTKSYFRDCNGTGYSKLGKELFSQVKSISNENGNIFDSETGNHLLGYYLVINSVFNVISSLAHSGWISEESLLAQFKNFLLELQGMTLADGTFIHYLLDSEELMHKGNFFCSFQNINENTAGNPLKIYTRIPNPIPGRIA